MLVMLMTESKMLQESTVGEADTVSGVTSSFDRRTSSPLFPKTCHAELVSLV